MNYVVVGTAKEVAEFLDDLAQHAEQDLAFQKALEENRARHAAVLTAAKSTSVNSPAKAPRAKPGPRTAKVKVDE